MHPVSHDIQTSATFVREACQKTSLSVFLDVIICSHTVLEVQSLLQMGPDRVATARHGKEGSRGSPAAVVGGGYRFSSLPGQSIP